MTKEDIIDEIKSVESAYINTVLPLEQKFHYGKFNFYWDVLAFILWIKEHHPDEYEKSLLDDYFKVFDEFGDLYIQLMEPSFNYFRYDDGILNIDKSIEIMISDLYKHVISLDSDFHIQEIYKILKSITVPVPEEPKSINRIETKVDNLIETLNPTPSKYKTKKEKRAANVKAQITKMLYKK